MMHGYFGEGWGNWMGFGFHGLWMVLFWGVLIWAVVALVRHVRPTTALQTTAPDSRDEDRALAVVRERYARGELTREQFDEMRNALQ